MKKAWPLRHSSFAIRPSLIRHFPPMPKLYIGTVGCQMNVLDSELVVASLRKEGFELTRSAADADCVLFNTCSVREHAEEKIYSGLGRLKNAKQKNPQKIIGV